MAFLFGKPPNKQEEAIGFEPEEQKTPWLGRILLVILAIVLLYFGWTGLSDLGRIPKQPERLSECSGVYSFRGRIGHVEIENYKAYVGSYITYDYRTGTPAPALKTCSFSSYEKLAEVSEVYREAQLNWQEQDNFSRYTIQPLQDRLFQLAGEISLKQEEYNTSLREVIAGKSPVGKTPDQLREELRGLQNQEETFAQELAQTQTTLAKLEGNLKNKELILVERINKAIDLYNKDWARYKFWVFLLEILFVVPFFVVSVWFYFRLLRKNSPHTIILLPIVFVGAVLLARTFILYFWASFLADLIEIILRLSGVLLVFRVLLFYFGMLLSIVVFGGAVYLLQRRIFAPSRVRLRRLKSRKCPHCETPFEFTQEFCAGCGERLLAKCSSCGQEAFVDFKFCPRCGAEKAPDA